MNKNHVVIVGGGISGLSTAFFLSRRISEEHLSLKITVLEASNRFGGVVRTLSHDGPMTEAAADAFYSGRSETLDLCRNLGLEGEIVEAAPCFRHFSILKAQKYFPLPATPVSFFGAVGFLENPSIGLSAKCRMFLEPFIPPRKEAGDESVASFTQRRLGRGFYREIAQPLIRGVYMADPERLSLEAMFPRFRRAERDSGSLGGSFLRRIRRKGKKSGGEFATLRNGLEGLVRALMARTGSCELRRSAVVKQCVYEKGWELVLEDGEKIRADVLCLAMGSRDASRLLTGAAPELSRDLSEIRYDSIATVNLVYRAEDVPAGDSECGFWVPSGGGSYPFSSLKWLGKTADEKYVPARAFISEAMLPEIFYEDDDTLGRKIRASLKEIFGVQATPQFMSVERYPSALPQYDTGHLERVAKIEEKARQYPGLYLAGNGFTGFGITDCICRAKTVASGLTLPASGNQVSGNHS